MTIKKNQLDLQHLQTALWTELISIHIREKKFEKQSIDKAQQKYIKSKGNLQKNKLNQLIYWYQGRFSLKNSIIFIV